jgi:hypothetical protein
LLTDIITKRVDLLASSASLVWKLASALGQQFSRRLLTTLAQSYGIGIEQQGGATDAANPGNNGGGGGGGGSALGAVLELLEYQNILRKVPVTELEREGATKADAFAAVDPTRSDGDGDGDGNDDVVYEFCNEMFRQVCYSVVLYEMRVELHTTIGNMCARMCTEAYAAKATKDAAAASATATAAAAVAAADGDSDDGGDDAAVVEPLPPFTGNTAGLSTVMRTFLNVCVSPQSLRAVRFQVNMALLSFFCTTVDDGGDDDDVRDDTLFEDAAAAVAAAAAAKAKALSVAEGVAAAAAAKAEAEAKAEVEKKPCPCGCLFLNRPCVMTHTKKSNVTIAPPPDTGCMCGCTILNRPCVMTGAFIKAPEPVGYVDADEIAKKEKEKEEAAKATARKGKRNKLVLFRRSMSSLLGGGGGGGGSSNSSSRRTSRSKNRLSTSSIGRASASTSGSGSGTRASLSSDLSGLLVGLQTTSSLAAGGGGDDDMSRVSVSSVNVDMLRGSTRSFQSYAASSVTSSSYMRLHSHDLKRMRELATSRNQALPLFIQQAQAFIKASAVRLKQLTDAVARRWRAATIAAKVTEARREIAIKQRLAQRLREKRRLAARLRKCLRGSLVGKLDDDGSSSCSSSSLTTSSSDFTSGRGSSDRSSGSNSEGDSIGSRDSDSGSGSGSRSGSGSGSGSSSSTDDESSSEDDEDAMARRRVSAVNAILRIRSQVSAWFLLCRDEIDAESRSVLFMFACACLHAHD